MSTSTSPGTTVRSRAPTVLMSVRLSKLSRTAATKSGSCALKRAVACLLQGSNARVVDSTTRYRWPRIRPGILRLLSREDDAVETLGIGVAFHCPESGRARPHPGLHGLPVAHLARVAGDSLELLVHGVRDVNGQLRLLPLDQVHLTHLVGLVIGQELGERQAVARERIDAIEHDAGGDPVIAVPAEEVGVRPVRMLRDDQVGPPPADLARDVEPQRPRVFHLAVLVPEKLHALDAERPGGVLLLCFADARQML